MDTNKTILAVGLSFIILLGYQYLFVKQPTELPEQVQGIATEDVDQGATGQANGSSSTRPASAPPAAVAAIRQIDLEPAPQGRDIAVDTGLFAAVLSEAGGGFNSFKLKEYNETAAPDSDLKQLIKTETPRELPLFFSWGVEPDKAEIPLFTAEKEGLRLTQPGSSGTMTMTASLASGLVLTRSMAIDADNYLIHLTIDVLNPTDTNLRGAPFLRLTNLPFATTTKSNRFLFSGPAVLMDDTLQEVKVKDLLEGQQTLTGNIAWTAYEGTYFMCAVLPTGDGPQTVYLNAESDKVTTVLSADADIIPAQGHQQYSYTIFFGPKKMSLLKGIGSGLEQAVNFGWFNVVARPTLNLLNLFYKFIGNYGVAIILVTILIKLIFWPIAHKGMKSMKNMQLLKPKMDKLREKYKDDSARLNQEMMTLYKTYKVNPLGGCLPMVLQIPVFFALYKVLMLAIELRHAPFMFWITDLSAPDRLWIGIDIPYLGGIPVLTLLMGVSMFLQQKLTPTAADPTQAKIMLMLPVVFTVMFVNFASGLVLYWFINNLLSIAQQYMINRSVTT